MDAAVDAGREFLNGGNMGPLMQAHDWRASPLGQPEAWPQSLRSALSICLGSGFPIAIYWGPALALLYNDAWSPIPGAKHPWALGRPARDVWPEIWDTIGPLFAHVMTTGEATRSKDELLPMRRRGYTEECYFDYTFSPIRAEDGSIGGIFNAVVETTFRVIGERRTRLLQSLGERVPVARSAEDACAVAAEVLASDPADLPFCLLYLAEDDGLARLAGITGLTAGQPLSPETIDLADPAAVWPVAAVLADSADIIADDCAARLGAALPAAPWPEPVQRAILVPIAGVGAARPAGAMIVGISPRLALDEEYRAFIGRAAAQIAAAIANARAYEQERRRAEALAEIDRVKTAFFSNVSHEFRTPLTLMLAPLEDALNDPSPAALPPMQRDRLDVAYRNSRRLLTLVNTLLDFSRIEAGRAQASYHPTDLAAVTADLAAGFRSAIERAGMRLEIDCDPLPEPVFVDRDMWEKIVLNLMSNAFKFTFEGAITISLRPQHGHAVLRVRDSGVGIPADELPRIFERFHRIEGQRSRSFEGSGIGLALVHELARLHGGTVEVRSELGQGTEFIVSLPFGTAHLAADRIGVAPGQISTTARAHTYVETALRWLPDAAGVAPDPTPAMNRLPVPDPAGRRPTILLADDNADMRGYVRRLLGEHYDVITVADGQAALEEIRRSPPDLLLSDVMMPRLDGFALLAELRGDSRTAGLPVLLLSARAGEDARVGGLRAGADDYLVKPFHARELLARVDGNLRLGRLRRAAEQRAVAQKNVLEMIAAGAPLDAVLDSICRYVEAQEPGAVVSIVPVDPNGTYFLRSRGPSLPDSYHDTVIGLSGEPPSIGTCPQALGICAPVSVPDVAVDATYAQPWRDLLLQHGLQSVRSTPVMGVNGQPVASLAIHYRTARDPLPVDAGLIDVAVNLISIGLERDRAQAELRQREENLRLIIDSAREYAILTTDLQGRISGWNAGAERILGYTSAEAIGMAFERLFLPEDRAAGIPRQELRIARSGGRAGNERWHQRADGSRFFASGITIPLDNGRGTLTIFRDRTEERRLQEEVEMRNAELRAVLEAVPVAVWFTYDPQARTAVGNQVAADLLGLPMEQTPSGANASRTAPAGEHSGLGSAERTAWQPPLQRSMRGEAVQGDLIRLQRDEGGVRYLTCSAAPLRGPSGAIVGAICTGTDVTERIDTERRLRDLTQTLERHVAETLAERKVLADIVDNTTAFVQVVGLDYRWLAINKASAQEFEHIFGIRPQVGDSMLQALAGQPEHLADVKAIWDRALSGEEFVETGVFGDPKRARRWYEMRFNTLRDDEGRRIGAYQFVYDVTQRLENEARLTEAHAQIHEMQKLETIGQLTGGIAHDFNNLLTPIVAGLEILRNRFAQDERALRLISGGLQSAERARVLVGRLLSFARRQVLEARPVFVPDLISGMADLIDRSLGPQIEVVLELPADLPSATVDPHQLELALLNLCVNARDAMPNGGTLRIVADQREFLGRMGSLAPGRYIRICVEDSGAGMDADTLRRAIEPFYTTKDVGRGTGLGLSMVHGLAAQSGGALILDSALGQGTRASVYLPVADARPASGPLVADTAPVTTPPLRILLVDDEELVRMGLRDLLEEQGHTVTDVASGVSALQRLRADPGVELLITDYMMPSMTGLALIGEARRLRPGLPALLVTGYATLDLAGAEDLPRLSKPFRKSDLGAAVLAAMQDKAADSGRGVWPRRAGSDPS